MRDRNNTNKDETYLKGCLKCIEATFWKLSSIVIFKKIGVLISALVMSLSIFSSAVANPQDGQVVNGNVTIQQNGNSTVINQDSQKGIINWGSFNIGQGESTHFQQPNGGMTLNRISPTQGVSQIYGRLTATGQIILMNPAGVYFGPSAYVNVGGLIATTANMTDHDFLNGNFKFSSVPGYSGAIINEGTIIAANNGLIAIVAPGVINKGVIQANLGSVILASGEAFTINFSGDNLINFSIDTKTSSQAIDKDGNKLRDGVTNSGRILADGGKVFISAKSASGVLDNVINMSGFVQARSVSQNQHGEIILSGDTGKVTVSGKLIATGKNAQQKGGKVKVLGQTVILADNALIDVSGNTGGGEVLFGGDYQGKNPNVFNAEHSFIGSQAQIKADALNAGDGGKIIVWANKTTQVYGDLSAKGGSIVGDGGFIETSGKYLDIQGIKINASATAGRTGTWLLDPSDLTISNDGTTNTNFSMNTYTANQPNLATIPNLNVDDLINALSSTNILVLTTIDGIGGNGDIYVNAPITWASNNTLTLSAYQNILLNADITNTNAASSANLVLRADNTGTGVGTICGAGNTLCGGSPSGVATLAGSGIVTAYYNPTSFGTQDTLYTGGTTPEAYMLINNAANLVDINNYSLGVGQNYALGRDIDLTSVVNFTPIGYFNAKFDGQGFTLSNLAINDNTSNTSLGLFSITDGATISNVNLFNLSITTTGDNNNVGGLIGYAANTAINNINVNGNINVSWNNIDPIYSQYTGGMIGQLDSNASLSNSISSVNVTSLVGSSNGFFHLGGAVGVNYGSVSNTTASGVIALTQSTNGSGFEIGGLIGSNFGVLNNSGIIGSSSSGTITVTSDVGMDVSQSIGGLIGYNNNTISNVISSANVDVNGNNDGGYRSVGGLIGASNNGSVTNANSIGSVQLTGNITSVLDGMNNIYYANDNVGGLIGNVGNNDAVVMQNLTSSSNVTVTGDIIGASRYVGGLFGNSQSNLVDASSTGNVNLIGSLNAIYLTGDFPNNANAYVGGLIGNNNNNSSSAYFMQNLNSSGNVIVNADNNGSWLFVGGLIGNNSEAALSNATSSSNVAVTSNATSIYLAGPLNPVLSAGENIGGLIGQNSNFASLSLQNLMSNGTITVQGDMVGASESVGGLIGNNRGTVTDATSSNSITLSSNLTTIYLDGSFSQNANANVGGSMGNNDNNGQSSYLQNIMSSGALNVSGDSIGGGRSVGGLIGNNSNSSILQSSSSSHIQLSGTLSTIYLVNDFAQNANDSVGGLLGNNYNNSSTSFILQNVSSVGNIDIIGNATGSGRSVGGLVGNNQGAIDTASSAGHITISGDLLSVDTGAPVNPWQGSYENVGGLIGSSNDGIIQNTSSSGEITIVANQVTGNPNVTSSSITVGGLVGNSNNTSQIIDSTSSGNVTLTAPSIFASNLSMGGFIGSNNNAISNSHSSGNVIAFINLNQANGNVAGFSGNVNGSSLNSTTSSNVTVYGPNSTPSAIIQAEIIDSQLTVGGFTGFISGLLTADNITGPINTGAVYLAAHVTHPTSPLSLLVLGGLVGQVFSGGVGGSLSGLENGSTITANITNDGGITLIGGIVGLNQSPLGIDPALTTYFNTMPVNVTVSNSNSGIVFIGGAVGGVLENLGQAYSQAPVTVSILNNTTNGIIGIGGFAGGLITASATSPTLINAYSTGSVRVTGQNNGGSVYVGGLLGLNGVNGSPIGPLPGGNVLNTYSAGQVSTNINSSSGQVAVGGLVGNIDPSGTVSNSFWDTATSGQSVGIGAGIGSNVIGGCLHGGNCAGGGTANLSAEVTYTNAGWNFVEPWGIAESVSYPYFGASIPAPPVAPPVAPTNGGVDPIVINQFIDVARILTVQLPNNFTVNGTDISIEITQNATSTRNNISIEGNLPSSNVLSNNLYNSLNSTVANLALQMFNETTPGSSYNLMNDIKGREFVREFKVLMMSESVSNILFGMLATVLISLSIKKYYAGFLRRKKFNEFTSDMSFKLRTNLNNINGYAALIHNNMVGQISREEKTYLEYIMFEANNILSKYLEVQPTKKGEIPTADLSFNLRTSLNNILGFTHILTTGKKDVHPSIAQKQFYQDILHSADEMMELVPIS